jgi:hypothetical protein
VRISRDRSVVPKRR